VLLVTSRDLGPLPSPLPRGADLALNAEVMASSYATDHLPNRAVDGVARTHWTAADTTFPQVLRVNLGGRFAPRQVVVESPGAALTYRVEGSNDAAGWVELGAAAGSFHYVRLVITGTADGSAASAGRLSIYES
jgi:hypothetical protein